MTSHPSVSTRRVETGTLYFVALLREELGRRIKTARTGAGMSQRELADKIGLKNAADVSRYERGTVEVPAHRIDLIAEATGRPRSYFTRDPSEPEVSPEAGGRLDAIENELEEVRRSLATLDAIQAALARIEARLPGPADPPRETPVEA